MVWIYIFQYISFNKTTLWLIPQALFWKWQYCCWHATANNQNKWQAHNEKMCITPFLLWCMMYIFNELIMQWLCPSLCLSWLVENGNFEPAAETITKGAVSACSFFNFDFMIRFFNEIPIHQLFVQYFSTQIVPGDIRFIQLTQQQNSSVNNGKARLWVLPHFSLCVCSFLQLKSPPMYQQCYHSPWIEFYMLAPISLHKC